MRVFGDFVLKQIQSCAFLFLLIGMLALTKWMPLGALPRYDALLLGCVALQLGMVRLGLETWRDVGVITLFHLLGLGLEIHKIHAGSWSYPEFSYLSVAGAPLYSGFMYSGVASYICLAWKRFDLELTGWPRLAWTLPLAALLYVQFFSSGWTLAHRMLMLGLAFVPFLRCWVAFSSGGRRLRMPMPVAYLLIGLMIWIAENIATFLGAWQYPYQAAGWVPVHATKWGSWTLLVLVSVIIVAEYKRITITSRALAEGLAHSLPRHS